VLDGPVRIYDVRTILGQPRTYADRASSPVPGSALGWQLIVSTLVVGSRCSFWWPVGAVRPVRGNCCGRAGGRGSDGGDRRRDRQCALGMFRPTTRRDRRDAMMRRGGIASSFGSLVLSR